MFLPVSLKKITLTHIAILYLVIAVVATIQSYPGHLHPASLPGKTYHSYNNYVIFKNSYFHLLRGRDLYSWYLDEQWDLYKYSPTFSLFFGLLAYLPDFIGLLIWNLFNCIPLLIGIVQLRHLTDRRKIFILVFCAVELLGSLQNSQSNGLTAGLLILTFTSLEHRRYVLAAFLVVSSVYLKIYGGIAFIFFLFYPSKGKLAACSIGWFLILGALPLLVTPLRLLRDQYASWARLLKADQADSVGVSVVGILQTWFNPDISKNMISLAGIALLFLPLVQIRKYKYYDFRSLFLAYTLIWIVIFNHKAESPTYIIAIAGIAIWYITQQPTILNRSLLVLAFIFTSLATGDLFPHVVKEKFIWPYNIKALFSIIIFAKIGYELFFRKWKYSDLPTEPVLA